MLTLANTIEILKSNNTAYWRLYARIGYGKPNLISTFMSEPEKRRTEETLETERDAANTMSQSIDQLTKQVNIHSNTPNVVFLLEYRAAPKSSDIRGPVEFINDSATGIIPSAPQMQQNAFAGLGGLPQMDFGSYLDQKLELERERNTIALERVNFTHEMKRKEEQLANERQKINEEKARLKELERDYLSDSNRAKNGFSMALKGILQDFIPESKDTGLKGVETTAETVQLTAEEQMIQSIATMVHEQFKDIEDIKVIGIMVQRFVNNRELLESYRDKILQNQL